MLLQAVFLASLSGTPAQASAPDITFSCKRMPEVCTNMCWAMRCAQPSFPQTLTWDNDSTFGTTKWANVQASSCRVWTNRCQRSKDTGHIGGKFYACDEYPFYFTLENTLSRGHAVSRCVRKSSNHLQGQMHRAVWKPWYEKGWTRRKMQVGLAHPGTKGVNYCLNQPCINDGFQMQDGMIKMDRVDKIYDRGEPSKSFSFYKTGSGLVIASMDQLTQGANFTRILHDEDETEEGLDHWVEDVDGTPLRFASDVMLGEVSAEVAALT